MENLYANLRNKIADYDIIYCEPMSYLKTIVSDKSNLLKTRPKVFVLCKKEQSQPKSEKSFSKIPKKVKKEDLDLTGSPLRDDCEIDYIEDTDLANSWMNLWSENDESFHAVPIIRAQQILSEIAMEMGIVNSTVAWAVCGANKENKLLSFLNLTSAWNTRGTITFTGLSSFEDISLANLQKKHFSIFRTTNIMNDVDVDVYFQLNSGLNNVKLQLSSSVRDSLSNFRLNNYEKYSRITLHQTVAINNLDSVAEIFWRQINILDQIKDSIVAFKESADSDDLVYNFGSSMELIDVKNQIFKCFTDMVSEYVRNEEEDVNVNIENIIEKAKTRESIELTDQLWDALKGCSSFADLKLAFEYIFHCAVKYNIVNVPASKNRLAKWIIDLSEKRMTIPHLNGSEPLELLLDIGIDKVTRDYEFIFTESKLCSAEGLKYTEKTIVKIESESSNVRKSLKALMNDPANQKKAEMNNRKTLLHTSTRSMKMEEETNCNKNSYFEKNKIEKRLAHLGQIHLILEHLLSIRSTFYHENVYVDFLEDLKRPTILFHLLKEQKTDSRIINVVNNKILNRIEGQSPSQMRIMMSSVSTFMKAENTFFYSNRAIFPPNVFDCISTDIKPDLYYGHHMLSFATRSP